MVEVLKDIKADQLTIDTARESSDSEFVPLCSYCGSKMMKRVARRGRNAGKSVWGCSKYANCLKVR